MTYHQELAATIERLHGAKATHAKSVSVKEVFGGKTVWDGVVEVYDLTGHPRTHTAYAWAHETDGKGKRHVTVLHIPPAISPETAVRASIAKEFYDASKV